MTAGSLEPILPAVDPTLADSKKKQHKRGAIRDNVEAFGVAILAAVLLKYFAIEAFQIPTSSMQPTMMGCVEAGVYDRLLVDKVRYRITEPQRGDILVFHYPLQQNQNYVKRMVGMGGDRINIAGGNLYFVTGDGQDRTFAPWRKPARIQGSMWREIYPYRRLLREEDTAIGSGKSFYATPGNKWREDGEEFTATLDESSAAKLVYTDEQDGGLVDRVWDGYSVAVGQEMRKLHFDEKRPQEIVPDVKFEVSLQPDGTLGECAFEIEVRRPGLETLVYALVLKGQKGQLLVRKLNGELVAAEAASSEFPFELAAGSQTHVGFARLDDMLYAFRDGKEVQTLDVAPWHTREGCELGGPKATADHRVNAQLLAKGKGKLVMRDVHLWRDQHYVRSSRQKNEIIEVPKDCYFMMGDNTLQSVDSRDWMAFSVGVMPDGTMVPPGTEGSRTVRGNKRPVPPQDAPDRDETPVVFPDKKELVMIDELGEILRLKTGISPAYGQDDGNGNRNFVFEPLGSSDGHSDWTPPSEHVAFVPREHVVGRALVAFWPIWPFAKQTRLGFYR